MLRKLAIAALTTSVVFPPTVFAAIAVSTLSCVMPNPANDAVVVDNAGNVYVSSMGTMINSSQWTGAGVLRIDSDCNVSVFAAITGPIGNAIDGGGNLYVSSAQFANDRRIYKVLPDGTITDFVQPTLQGTGGGLVLDSNQNLYVASYEGDTISKFDSFGNLIDKFFASGGSLNGPAGLAIDNNDNLYASNFDDGVITKIASDGSMSVLTAIGASLGYIAYVNDNLYATGFSSQLIYRITLSGDVSVIAGSSAGTVDSNDPCTAKFNNPNGIYGNPSGDKIYISQWSNGPVRVLDLSGDDGSTCGGSSGTPPANSPPSGGDSGGSSSGGSVTLPSIIFLFVYFIVSGRRKRL